MKSKLFFKGLLVLALLNVNSWLFAQVTETRNVSGFSAIEAASVFNITVNKASVESLVVEADEAIMPDVCTEVKNGVLKLYLKNSHKTRNIGTLKVTVGVKELKAVKLSGACKLASDDVFETGKFDIKLSGACGVKLNVKTNELDADLSGACHLNLTADVRKAEFDVSGAPNLKLDLKAANLSFDMSGASKVELKGTADKVEFEASGASTVKASALLCKTMVIESSGACKLEVNASERLTISTSGSSTVLYSGRPMINASTSGASRVRSME
jgi:hypothetical protein